MFIKVKKTFFRILQFFRITDENNNLSFTYLMMWEFLYKMKDMQLGAVDTTSILLTALPVGTYLSKKVIPMVQAKLTGTKPQPTDEAPVEGAQ
jgi:hypothetical protein